jgi:hypothetical protein
MEPKLTLVRRSASEPKSPKIRPQVAKATKKRMTEILSYISGFTEYGLDYLRPEAFRAGCSDEELLQWTRIARDSAKAIRKWARDLEGYIQPGSKEDSSAAASRMVSGVDRRQLKFNFDQRGENDQPAVDDTAEPTTGPVTPTAARPAKK